LRLPVFSHVNRPSGLLTWLKPCFYERQGTRKSMFAKNQNNKNKGQVLVLVALSLVVFMGFAALVIDVAYFYHTRHQLQGAADAAALAGAANLDGSNLTTQLLARQEAFKYAGLNTASGSSVVLSPVAQNNNALSHDNDITVVNWDDTLSPRYDTGRTPINAVQVRTRRTSDSPGLGVVRFFGKIFRSDTQDVWAEATAISIPGGLSPLAANEYWYGDNPSSWPATRVYPNSFFREKNFDGSTSTNWLTSPGNFHTGSDYTQGLSGTAAIKDPECHSEIFALAGARANPNSSGTGDKSGYAALDYRTNSYEEQKKFSDENWYHMTGVSTYQTLSAQGQVNPSLKDDFVPFLNSGYNKDLPISIPGGEKFIANYDAGPPLKPSIPYTSPGTSSYSWATVAYVSGVSTAVSKEMYSLSKFAPGKKVAVLVYDGLVQGSGPTKRVTHVGYAQVKIIGYGTAIDNATYTSGNTLYACTIIPIESCDTPQDCKKVIDKIASKTCRLVQ